jgi:hypothetical protein
VDTHGSSDRAVTGAMITTLPLPEVLAGPILRRVDRRQVAAWMATSVERRVHVEVFRLAGPGLDRLEPLGSAPARRVRMGERLWVHLAVVEPGATSGFPVGELLAFDAVLDGAAQPRRLADIRSLDGPTAIGYGDLPLPTFHIQPPGQALRVLHGSCRLLHGNGHDAFVAADRLLADTATDLGRRPSALLLTGDQIYGDEVAGPLVGHLTRLGRAIMGDDDDVSVPGVGSLSELPVYGRQPTADRAGFTSTKAGNHLLSLGEYLAAHLVAWDDATWPDDLPTFDDVVAVDGSMTARFRQRRRFGQERACLETSRAALPAVRRVLANIPTYMCFDDHDVTDDWNLTRAWRDAVQRSSTGRRVVANALAAFWACQGWGNQPDAFADEFVAAVAWGADRPPDERFERTLWSFDCWSFVAPTHPPTVVLDTRTQRSYDSDEGAARLMSDGELGRVRALCQEVGVEGETPAVFVSPVPVFGLELQERRQKFLAGKLGPYEIDFEAWHSNLQGLVDFMELLVDELGLRRCVILSGDVHYGLNVDVTFSIGDDELAVAQLVSSAVKHSGNLARTLLDLLGRLVTATHERKGWRSPPELPATSGPSRLLGRWLQRPVNTDEWHDGAPVFLNGKVAGTVEAEEDPDYRERRTYVAPEQRPHFSLVGENNIGFLTMDDDGVVHRHLVPVGPDKVKAYVAELPWPREHR